MSCAGAVPYQLFFVGQCYFILLLAAVFLFTHPVFVDVCFPPRCLLSSLLTGHQGAQMAGLAWNGKVVVVIPWGLHPLSFSAA